MTQEIYISHGRWLWSFLHNFYYMWILIALELQKQTALSLLLPAQNQYAVWLAWLVWLLDHTCWLWLKRSWLVRSMDKMFGRWLVRKSSVAPEPSCISLRNKQVKPVPALLLANRINLGYREQNPSVDDWIYAVNSELLLFVLLWSNTHPSTTSQYYSRVSAGVL